MSSSPNYYFFLIVFPLICRINYIIHMYYFFIQIFNTFYFICSRAIEILPTRANGSPSLIYIKKKYCVTLRVLTMNGATLCFGLARFSIYFIALLRIPRAVGARCCSPELYAFFSVIPYVLPGTKKRIFFLGVKEFENKVCYFTYNFPCFPHITEICNLCKTICLS